MEIKGEKAQRIAEAFEAKSALGVENYNRLQKQYAEIKQDYEKKSIGHSLTKEQPYFMDSFDRWAYNLLKANDLLNESNSQKDRTEFIEKELKEYQMP